MTYVVHHYKYSLEPMVCIHRTLCGDNIFSPSAFFALVFALFIPYNCVKNQKFGFNFFFCLIAIISAASFSSFVVKRRKLNFAKRGHGEFDPAPWGDDEKA